MINVIKRNWIKLLLSVPGGFLWRMGGSDTFSKIVRRAGVAGYLGVISILKTKCWITSILSAGLAFGAYSLGYGESGHIWEFWREIVGVTNHLLGDILTRASVGMAYGLAYVPTVIRLKAWKKWFIPLLPIIIIPALRLLGNGIGATLEEIMIGCSVVLCFLFIKK